MTSRGGQGRSPVSKDFMAPAGMVSRIHAGISIVDSSPGVKGTIVYEIISPSVDRPPQLSAAKISLKPTQIDGEVLSIGLARIPQNCVPTRLTIQRCLWWQYAPRLDSRDYQ